MCGINLSIIISNVPFFFSEGNNNNKNNNSNNNNNDNDNDNDNNNNINNSNNNNNNNNNNNYRGCFLASLGNLLLPRANGETSFNIINSCANL